MNQSASNSNNESTLARAKLLTNWSNNETKNTIHRSRKKSEFWSHGRNHLFGHYLAMFWMTVTLSHQSKRLDFCLILAYLSHQTKCNGCGDCSEKWQSCPVVKQAARNVRYILCADKNKTLKSKVVGLKSCWYYFRTIHSYVILMRLRRVCDKKKLY
jgi:hypothetical protein